MEPISVLANLFLHLDKNLSLVIQQYGTFTYVFLFLIIFMETGFVVTPFLPGDSLLFVAGTFAASNTLDINLLFGSLAFAAVAGDTANYWIGHYSGPRVFKENSRFLKKEHLDKTHRFYEKHGGKAIILARFVPIVRTFAPFVAGVGKMTYGRFFAYNIIGGLTWVAIFILGGYFFGNLPIVKNNFHLVVMAIIIISILPAAIEYLKHKKEVKLSKVNG
jgi:membrane-associated protein